MTHHLITVDIIGIIAGLLIILSLIPQLVIIIRNKSAKDISVLMYIVLFVAQILWLVYGVLKNDLQVTITNVITSFITILVICFSLYFNYCNSCKLCNSTEIV
jgi:MtN3 and saliva related transmembrane protein